MKLIIYTTIFTLLIFSSLQAQVGKISADGNADYAMEAQTLKRQRGAAPTYEQLVPQNVYYRGAVASPQEAAQNVLTTENQYSNGEKRKINKGRLLSFGTQKEARNIMIVEAVARYKLGDKKLADQFESLEDNAEYQRKIEQIMENLSNESMRNNKNKEAIRILNDAGNRLYNLLAN